MIFNDKNDFIVFDVIKVYIKVDIFICEIVNFFIFFVDNGINKIIDFFGVIIWEFDIVW